jgi:hypothetical protein
MDQLPEIPIKIKPEKPTQSVDVGDTPKVRRKKFKEVQSLKEVAKLHMNKLSQGLRP